MKRFTQGGTHPPENKISYEKSISKMPLPTKVFIPLNQHLGAPAQPLVSKGEQVKVGQLIASASGFISANIHATISGKVILIDELPNAQGLRVPTIVIERAADEEDIWIEEADLSPTLLREIKLSSSEIIERVKWAGIVGLGGATFPTNVKLSIPQGKKADILIINGAECEPYLSSDHRSMLERGEELLVGTQILMRALGVSKAAIGIETNKMDAIKHLQNLSVSYEGIKIEPLQVKYPQGGEKQLIEAITGLEVPPPPALPIDVGAVVVNVSTAIAVYEAVQKNRPLVERVVSVSGKSMADSANLLTRFGTPISALFEQVGGLPEDTGKVINGGPMMGRAMINLDAPVAKGCSGVTVISRKEARRKTESKCIKCAKCVSVCPMALEPFLLERLTRRDMVERLEEERVVDCIECGCCQFTCPARIPLLDFVRLGKQQTMAAIRARS